MTETADLRHIIRMKDVEAYSPANHLGTVNRRLIGKETVGASNIEVVLGVVTKDGGAQPHMHPGIEQVVYVLEGQARAEVGGEVGEMGPGDTCYFPPDTSHSFVAISDTPVKCLVIYSPPYQESPERGVAQ